MSNFDLESVIEDSVNESIQDTEPVAEVADDVTSDVDTTVTDDASTDTVPTEEVVEGEVPSSQVTKPGDGSAEVEDEFSKKFGISSKSITGRENRIPYSRVKKIVEKAQKDATDKLTKELDAKYQTKITEYDGKIKDLETRGGNKELESIIDTQPREFLQILSNHPAYKGFFEYLNQHLPKDPAQNPTQQGQPKGAPTGGEDAMPQPNKKLSDGSLVYDMDGLQELLKWQARQTETSVTTKMTEQFGPIRKEWEARQQIEKIMPVIDQEIAAARQWPNFAELEDEIVQLLESDQKISLEGAYRTVYHKNVVPKLQSANDRNKIREEVIAELKSKGGVPSVKSTQTTPKTVPTNAGKSLVDIIAGEVEKIR